MLKDVFFSITSLTGEPPSFSASLTLNAQHRIFGGHFPGQPVVPGVCLMQMVQEVAETALGDLHLRLVRAGQIKLLMPVDPRNAGILDIKLNCEQAEDGVIRVIASITHDGKTCFKFNGVFVLE